MQVIKKLNQKKSCFKVSFFKSGTKGIFRDIQQIKSEKQSPKSKHIGPQGHDAYDPVPLSLRVKKNVAQSLSHDGS